MRIHVLKDPHPAETRVALSPEGAKRLLALGCAVSIAPSAGVKSSWSDDHYRNTGASIAETSEAVPSADIILSVRKPDVDLLPACKPGTLLISLLDPFGSSEYVQDLLARKLTAISLELIPRTTLAQKMDVLSSQASLAGYVAVMLAASRLPKIFPMMMTPAGTIQASRVFIIGAGVAGLQAIATAKRLGARVDAFDTRPVVEEQVQSLGAKFVKLDLGETGQTAGGYAKELMPEQIEKQRQLMTKYCAQADVIITTALLFGKPAPIIVTKHMLEAMQPGSIVIDLAIEGGGNVEGAVRGAVTQIGGAQVIAYENMAGRVPLHASQMFASNVVNLIEHFWDKDTKTIRLDQSDEIMASCLAVRDGQVVSKVLKG